MQCTLQCTAAAQAHALVHAQKTASARQAEPFAFLAFPLVHFAGALWPTAPHCTDDFPHWRLRSMPDGPQRSEPVLKVTPIRGRCRRIELPLHCCIVCCITQDCALWTQTDAIRLNESVAALRSDRIGSCSPIVLLGYSLGQSTRSTSLARLRRIRCDSCGLDR